MMFITDPENKIGQPLMSPPGIPTPIVTYSPQALAQPITLN